MAGQCRREPEREPRDSRQKVMHDDLMEQVAAEENLRRALGAVKRNRGAAGIDGMTTEQLESHLARHGEKIRAKLLAGRWTPSPVRRVEKPKPHGGQRLLGIPTVMDRLLQQALLQVLTPIFEPGFGSRCSASRATDFGRGGARMRRYAWHRDTSARARTGWWI